MNAGPANLIQEENDMIPVIKELAHDFDETDFSKIFDAYNLIDFERDVANYERAKDAQDPWYPRTTSAWLRSFATYFLPVHQSISRLRSTSSQVLSILTFQGHGCTF